MGSNPIVHVSKSVFGNRNQTIHSEGFAPSSLEELLWRKYFFIQASCNVIMLCIVNQFHEGVLTKEYCYGIFLFAIGAVYDYFVNSNAYWKLLLFFYKLIFIYVFVYWLIYVSLFPCHSKRWNTCPNSMAIICRNDV
jgi:hypothetical protein